MWGKFSEIKHEEMPRNLKQLAKEGHLRQLRSDQKCQPVQVGAQHCTPLSNHPHNQPQRSPQQQQRPLPAYWSARSQDGASDGLAIERSAVAIYAWLSETRFGLFIATICSPHLLFAIHESSRFILCPSAPSPPSAAITLVLLLPSPAT